MQVFAKILKSHKKKTLQWTCRWSRPSSFMNSAVSKFCKTSIYFMKQVVKVIQQYYRCHVLSIWLHKYNIFLIMAISRNQVSIIKKLASFFRANPWTGFYMIETSVMIKLVIGKICTLWLAIFLLLSILPEQN